MKRHVKMILERLLRTVNCRVIVLDREHGLRVSTAASRLRALLGWGGSLGVLGGRGLGISSGECV